MIAAVTVLLAVTDVLRSAGAFILVLLLVVIVHEFGHFAVGKLSGIRVDEFAVGFGPKVWGVTRGETLYALRAIPAGGFVRLAGMSGLENDGAGERSFYRSTIPRKMATIAAGGLINLLLAGVLFGITLMPAAASTVSSDGGAAAAGLRPGDVIDSVNGESLDTTNQEAVGHAVRVATATGHGNPISVGYIDASGAHRSASVVPTLFLYNGVGAKDDPSGGAALPQGVLVISRINGRPVGHGDAAAVLGDGGPVTVSGRQEGVDTPRQFTDVAISGVGAAPLDAPSTDIGRLEAAWRIGYGGGSTAKSFPAAMVAGFRDVPTQIRSMAVSLGQVISRPSSGGLTGPIGASGPVGIYNATSDASQSGWLALVYVAALISLNLGVINLLPIPFLDGGRFVFIMIEAVRRRRVDPHLEARIHLAGLAVILTFAVYITIFGDIGRLLSPS